MVVVHDPLIPEDLEDKFVRQPLDAQLPLTECARTAAPVVVGDRSAFARRYPHVVDDIDRIGVRAVICVPLSLGDEATTGVLGFAWRAPISDRRLEEILTAARSVGQVVGRAFERAQADEATYRQSELLSELTDRIARASTTDAIGAAVEDYVPQLLAAHAACLSPRAPVDDAESRAFRLRTTRKCFLVVELGDSQWKLTTDALAVAIVELVGGAWERADASEREHLVLQRLQDSLLSPPGEVPEFDIAVSYRSAFAADSMGGDWYSTIDTDDALYVLVGDVAGHGPGAVAVMAEIKTIVRHLLGAGESMPSVLHHANVSLKRRRAYASIVIARADKRTSELTYINAGHPYPLLATSTSTNVLLGTHRPWLGVDAETSAPTTVDLLPGCTLLLYTDGLVEERREVIDDSIRRLASAFRPGSNLQLCVDALVADRVDHRTTNSTDDDIALLALRRRV